MGHLLHIPVEGEPTVILDNVTSEQVNDNFLNFLAFGRGAICTLFEVELVWVLHNGKRRLMLVDEFGATNMGGDDYPLPVNPQATEIYHAASRARGQDWEGAPYIHGDAVLFVDIDVE